MSSTIFPYRKDHSGYFFPSILVRITHKNKFTDVYGLIDSGATMPLFRQDTARVLNLKITDGEPISLGGVGGNIKGYIHNLRMEVAGKSFMSPIVFSLQYQASFNLLGRNAFFENFKITFDEKQKIVTLE